MRLRRLVFVTMSIVAFLLLGSYVANAASGGSGGLLRAGLTVPGSTTPGTSGGSGGGSSSGGAGAGTTIAVPGDTTPGDTSVPLGLRTTSNVDGKWHRATFTVKLVASGGSGAMHTYFRLPGKSTHVYSRPFAIAVAGVTAVTFWSTDSAGNVEARQTALVKIDRILPTAVSDAKPGYRRSAAIRVSASDHRGGSGVATIRYFVDRRATVIVAANPVTVNVPSAGNHSVTFWAVDNAGNSSPRTVRIVTVTHVTAVSLTSSSATVRAGGRTHITGALLDSTARSTLRGKLVTLQVYAAAGHGHAWATLAATMAGKGGSFDFVVRPRIKTSYRVLFSGVVGYARSVSSTVVFTPAR